MGSCEYEFKLFNAVKNTEQCTAKSPAFELIEKEKRRFSYFLPDYYFQNDIKRYLLQKFF